MHAPRPLAALLLAALLPLSVFAQEFPARALRVIAPVPPGSPPDLVARLVSEPLSRALGQPVVVENRPGGNQTIGLAAVASAAPDGHTLGVVSLPTAVVPALMAKMPYDTLRDLAPVRELAWTSNVLIVRGDSELRSIPDLVAAARSGKLAYASGGNGTPAHVMAELFRNAVRIDALHVPFKGAPEGVHAVIAGQVHFMLASAGAVAPHVRAGKVRALAQTTSTRLPMLPGIATFGEVGLPAIAVRDWQGLVAPAGTPPAVLARLSDALAASLSRPEIRERLGPMGMEAVQESDPARFSAFLTSEVRRWGEVAAAAGLQAQ